MVFQGPTLETHDLRSSNNRWWTSRRSSRCLCCQKTIAHDNDIKGLVRSKFCFRKN